MIHFIAFIGHFFAGRFLRIWITITISRFLTTSRCPIFFMLLDNTLLSLRMLHWFVEALSVIKYLHWLKQNLHNIKKENSWVKSAFPILSSAVAQKRISVTWCESARQNGWPPRLCTNSHTNTAASTQHFGGKRRKNSRESEDTKNVIISLFSAARRPPAIHHSETRDGKWTKLSQGITFMRTEAKYSVSTL